MKKNKLCLATKLITNLQNGMVVGLSVDLITFRLGYSCLRLGMKKKLKLRLNVAFVVSPFCYKFINVSYINAQCVLYILRRLATLHKQFLTSILMHFYKKLLLILLLLSDKSKKAYFGLKDVFFPFTTNFRTLLVSFVIADR